MFGKVIKDEVLVIELIFYKIYNEFLGVKQGQMF